MAGDGHHQPVKIDPAVERWNYMRENVYQHFKFTRRATRQVVMLGLVFPAVVAGIALANDAKWDWAGKQKGSSLLTVAPPVMKPLAEEE